MSRKEKFLKILDRMTEIEKEGLENGLRQLGMTFDEFIKKLDILYELNDYLNKIIDKYMNMIKENINE